MAINSNYNSTFTCDFVADNTLLNPGVSQAPSTILLEYTPNGGATITPLPLSQTSLGNPRGFMFGLGFVGVTFDWFTAPFPGAYLPANPGDGTLTLTLTWDFSTYNSLNNCNVPNFTATDSFVVVYGCMDPTSGNYNPNATVHNFSC